MYSALSLLHTPLSATLLSPFFSLFFKGNCIWVFVIHFQMINKLLYC